MSMLQTITKVRTESAVLTRKKVAVGGVRYVVTLECGHKVETKAYTHGSKHPVPKVGKRKRCTECRSTDQDVCDCIPKLNEHLKQFNTRLTYKSTINMRTQKVGEFLVVATEKIEPRKRGEARPVLATYCPFCGAKLASYA